MNSKRSYLDTLNAGRQRRPDTTLDQLNRSLETLEQRLERSREETTMRPDGRYARAEPYGQRAYDAPRAAPRPSYADASARPAPRAAAPGFGQDYRQIARDIDRMRGQEDGVAMAGKIATELRGLREELRHQMTVGLHREFEALRKDIERAYQAAPSAKDSAELGLEFERLSGAIHALAEKSDDRSVNMLRLELEQVKSALDTLAREESLRAVDRRWDDFDRRWDAFEKRAGGPGLDALTERLEQIGAAVNNLPESLSLRSLEEKVRTLASAVDHFAGQQKGAGSDMLGIIDERLDEISRAIVASTVAAKANAFDPQPFERIEQRIAALASQIEEVAHDRPDREVVERLNMLSSRVDDLAARAHLPEQVMERLGQQIALIADRVDRAPASPDMDYLFQGIEHRFDALTGMIEQRQGDALEQGNMLLRDLERRLEEVAERLDRHPPEATLDSAGIMEAIDARFTALAKRLETRAPDAASETAIRGLESRLENISSRLDASAAQVGSIDPGLIRSLEEQVAGLSAHLSKPGSPLPDFEDIGPRLATIEHSLAGSQDSILEAARQAAESAVRSMVAQGIGADGSSQAVSGLAQDLKTLEALTRRSDERNTKTFEAIHDTLLKIVDRLGSLENGPAEPDAQRQPMKIAVNAPPSMDYDEPLPLNAGTTAGAEDILSPVMRGDATQRTPAQAAAAAAMAALDSETIAEKSGRDGGRKSMFGGLARAFSRKEAEPEPPLAGSAPAVETPSVDLDEPLDPKLANRPLEPGSGAPDLNAIMKRVRDERGQPARASEGGTGNADFIAAARRAAQAAAAEAEVLKRQSTMKGQGKGSRIGDLIKARRKPILMAAAAIMLALAGLQLGKAFLSDPAQVSKSSAPAGTANPAADSAAKSSAAPKTIDQQQAAQADADPIPVVRQADNGAGSDSKAAGGTAAADPAANAGGMTAPAAASADMPAASAPATPAPDAAAQNAMAEPAAAAPSNADAGKDTAANDANGAAASAEAPPAQSAAADIPAEAGPAALREAAAGGDAKAMFEIGSRYADGRGVKEDMKAAARWYEKAAEAGFAPAEYRIGNFYEKGIGVERDIKKSKTWYQLAAEQGNASAMHNLAVLYAMGADGTTDNDTATRWFQQAAELGVKDSQFNLGILAAKGVGMKQNLEESYKWFALVAKTGDKDATAKRDEIANALRPEQLERARASVELWKAKPLDPAANSVDIPESWREDARTTTASIDMKKAVQNIQRILNKNGYDAGKADGVMGEKTRNAIIAFQGANGMKATGQVDEALVKALLARK